MKTNKAILCAAVALTFLPARAQQPGGDLNREMEVTREYEPSVNAASKLGVKPNMVDTVALRPEVDFSVTPRPVTRGFGVTPIKPVQVNLDDYRTFGPLYVKAGVGAPLQSVLDAYFSSTQKRDGKWGVYVNHYGSWSDIKNVNGIKTPAAQTFNSVGAYGEHRFGRFGISGEIGYDYDKISRYGYDTTFLVEDPDYDPALWPLDRSASGLRQNFSTVRGRLVLGHAFEDLSYFNIRFGAEGAYFQDRFDKKEGDVKAFLDLGKRFGGRHEVTLHVGYDYYKGAGSLKAQYFEEVPETVPMYEDRILTIAPLYRLRSGRAEIALGVTYVLDNDGFRNESALFPQVEFLWNPAGGGFVPYLRVDGRYRNNGYRATVANNPYVFQGRYGKNTAEYNGRLGIRGGVASSFAYHVWGGYSRYRNMNFYANRCEGLGALHAAGNTFDVLHADVSMWTLGGEIEARFSSSFGALLSVQYRWYDTKDRFRDSPDSPGLAYYLGLPDLTAGLTLEYRYRDKFLLKAGADVLGPRDFTDWVNGSQPFVRQHVDMQVDVHLEAEYNLSKAIGIFVEGRNLANQKMFYYNMYPALGVHALFGVKLQF